MIYDLERRSFGNKATQYVALFFFGSILLISLYLFSVAVFKIPNGFLFSAGPAGYWLFYLLPLFPLYGFWAIRRQYYVIDIIGDNLVFRGWLKRSLLVDPRRITKISREQIPSETSYDVLKFFNDGTVIIVNNDMKDLDMLLSWIKQKNPAVILDNIDGKK